MQNSVPAADRNDKLFVFLNDKLLGFVVEAKASTPTEEGYVIQEVPQGDKMLRMVSRGRVAIKFNDQDVFSVKVGENYNHYSKRLVSESASEG